MIPNWETARVYLTQTYQAIFQVNADANVAYMKIFIFTVFSVYGTYQSKVW